MRRIKVILEDENGEAIASKSYNLGADFSTLDKIEDAVSSISAGLLTDITHDILHIEQDTFLKKKGIK